MYFSCKFLCRNSVPVRRALDVLLNFPEEADVRCRELDPDRQRADCGDEQWRNLPWSSLRLCGMSATPARKLISRL